MKLLKIVTLFMAAWFGLSVAMTGCTCVIHSYHNQTPGTVFVSKPPPPPKSETKTAPPSSGHVWVGGHWDWEESDKEWTWDEGTWEKPPTADAKWKEPSYDDNNGDNTYTPGHWVQEGISTSDDTDTITPNPKIVDLRIPDKDGAEKENTEKNNPDPDRIKNNPDKKSVNADQTRPGWGAGAGEDGLAKFPKDNKLDKPRHTKDPEFSKPPVNTKDHPSAGEGKTLSTTKDVSDDSGHGPGKPGKGDNNAVSSKNNQKKKIKKSRSKKSKKKKTRSPSKPL